MGLWDPLQMAVSFIAKKIGAHPNYLLSGGPILQVGHDVCPMAQPRAVAPDSKPGETSRS